MPPLPALLAEVASKGPDTPVLKTQFKRKKQVANISLGGPDGKHMVSMHHVRMLLMDICNKIQEVDPGVATSVLETGRDFLEHHRGPCHICTRAGEDQA